MFLRSEVAECDWDSRSRKHHFRGNQAIVCSLCNQAKGSLSLGRWLYRLRAAGDPRAEHVAAFVGRLMGTDKADHHDRQLERCAIGRPLPRRHLQHLMAARTLRYEPSAVS